MKRWFAILFLALGLVVACTGSQDTPVARPTPTRAPPAPYSSPTPFPFTSVPLQALPAYPTPEGADLSRMAFPPQDLPDGAIPPVPTATQSDRAYYLIGQAVIGPYTVREWQDPGMGWGIATISAGDQVLAQAEGQRLEVRQARRDLTGEGHPDVIVHLRSPDASYISSSTQVYDLGPVLAKVLETPRVACDPTYEVPCPWMGVFSDLDADGSAEFVTCDDAPRWGYYGASNTNPYAEHRRLMVTAFLEYQPGQGYIPAGPRFASLYAPNIESYTRKAEDEAALDLSSRRGYSPDALVALAFNYLYSGRPEEAWAELDRLHDGPDKVLVWSEILRQALDSPFYTAGGPLPDVPVPDYYTLAARFGCEPHPDCSITPVPGQPTCEPVEWLAQQFAARWDAPISVLVRGQKPCDAGVAVRSLAWLEDQLTRAGVIEVSQSLQVTSWDCTDKCRLAVTEWRGVGDNIPVGFIELEASGGFPGEIVRLDVEGREDTRWRLRGDLVWEAVPP